MVNFKTGKSDNMIRKHVDLSSSGTADLIKWIGDNVTNLQEHGKAQGEALGLLKQLQKKPKLEDAKRIASDYDEALNTMKAKMPAPLTDFLARLPREDEMQNMLTQNMLVIVSKIYEEIKGGFPNYEFEITNAPNNAGAYLTAYKTATKTTGLFRKKTDNVKTRVVMLSALRGYGYNLVVERSITGPDNILANRMKELLAKYNIKYMLH